MFLLDVRHSYAIPCGKYDYGQKRVLPFSALTNRLDYMEMGVGSNLVKLEVVWNTSEEVGNER